MRTALIVFLAAILLCSCSDNSGGNALVRLSLEIPDAPQAKILADSQEIKSDYRIALHVSADAADMTAAVEAEAVVTQDEIFDGSVELEMEVPAGSTRSFEGLLFTDDLRAYASQTPAVLDLKEGASVDLELTLKRLDAGSITVKLPQTAVETFYLTLEEETSSLRMPAVLCNSGECVFSAAPLGLRLTPILLNPDGSETRLETLELSPAAPEAEINAEK